MSESLVSRIIFALTLRDVHGSSDKFSVCFYDRNTVERLFGETSLEQEYRSTRTELFDKDGKGLADIGKQLEAAWPASDTYDKMTCYVLNQLTR
jgi:hypothetical protein